MASDAFLVGEDWISEHYFNTDSAKQSMQGRLAQLRKGWDAREADGEVTPRRALAETRGDILSALSHLQPDFSNEAWRDSFDAENYRARILRPLEQALGFRSSLWHREENGSVAILAPHSTPDIPAGALLLAHPVENATDLLDKKLPTLVDPFDPEGEPQPVTSVAKALSWLFAGSQAPAFAVVLAGSHALLVERERWAEGRYLAVDLHLVLDRNDSKKRAGEFDRAVAILGAELSLPGPDGTVWWAETLDDAVKHTVGVSQDLRDGVRESIEIIANEVVRRRAASGRDVLPQSQAQELARESLRYLYRILFLLFAEASPELKVLPVGAPEYALGYGLDRLRELVLVELPHEATDRTHFYQSLDRLFTLVDAGHDSGNSEISDDVDADLAEGLDFHPLNADLFAQKATQLIDEVGLGDGALQQVLSLLLLTREQRSQKGGDRGYISYADLGVNQLGAVYEGLMSYSGFFAETDLFEVAKDGDASKGSWVVPVDRSSSISASDFVMRANQFTGAMEPRRYSNGEFVFRLSGRERQTSASYYSPEVLTQFVVGQALEELLDQDGETTTAADILTMSVCEPALGSGAFAIEAVRQLADEYLTRRENEVGEKIDPDQRPAELQKARAAIALHQVYGVDLNATAVELAEVSLWLDTMVDGLQAPWFGLRLKRGNSLIGARRSVYSTSQIDSRAWLKDAPTPVAVAGLVAEMDAGNVAAETSGRVHHFLLPAEGWGAACDAKEAKKLAPDAHAALNTWRKGVRHKPSKSQVKRLVGLAHRVETLWQFTLRRLEIAEDQARREVALWKDPREGTDETKAVGRAEIERFLHDQDGAYQRLRRVMDAWCALWFWPLTNELVGDIQPPSLDEWLDGLTALLGVHVEVKAPKRASEGAQTLALPTNWHDLGKAEEVELGFASVRTIEQALAEHPWLGAVEAIARSNGFFHWELDFARVFSRGGFDLQVGNPPWVRPDFDLTASLAEHDPWFALTNKPSTTEFASHKEKALQRGLPEVISDETAVVSARAFVGSSQMYPTLIGLRPDLYRCFMALTWSHLSERGSIGLIHPESHFTDEKAGALRKATYGHLRRHWQFVNELSLFEIHHLVSYGVHIYGDAGAPHYLNATNLYHPETVIGSLRHDGSGDEPGLKNEEGKWDLRPHAARITVVDDAVLETWHQLLEDETTPLRHTRMVYAVNQATASVLAKLAEAPRLGKLGLEFSAGWNEKTDHDNGTFRKEWGQIESWDQAILQGPHLFVGNPFYKSPNASMSSNKDWSAVDLETLPPNAMPVTSYKPAKPRAEYDAAYTHWGPDHIPARSHYRIAWRAMAANTGERTLISAIIPPGAAHINGVFSAGTLSGSVEDLLDAAVMASSLLADLSVRSAPKSGIYQNVFFRLPSGLAERLRSQAHHRYLRLTALTGAYRPLWQSASGSPWTPDVPLRRAVDRRQAQVEIDAIVALSLGITADELCTIYRTQFAVLYGYDRNDYFYDANGRLVPNEVLKVFKSKGDSITMAERTATNASGNTYEYELPFVTLDREADMRAAYQHFEQVLRENA